jgi:hypothetical protein
MSTVAASCDAKPPGALGSTGAWGWSSVTASSSSAGGAATAAGIGCAFRMLSKALVQGRHSVDPGSDGAPQLSHGPMVSATVGACDRSTASTPGASLSLPPQEGQNLALSTTVVWQWSQYTRLFSGPWLRRSHVSPATMVASSLPRRGGDARTLEHRRAGLQARDGLCGPVQPARRRHERLHDAS